MSLKNQMLIVGKIKSINPEFIPKIEVDSRAAPDERELQFMAELVIAVNNLTNVRNVNKIFFNRQVKTYNNCPARQQLIRSFRGSIELYVNLHRHNLNIDRTLSCITSERSQAFIRSRQSYENVNFVKAEVKEVSVKEVTVKEVAVKEVAVKPVESKEVKVKDMKRINRNITVEINGVIKTVNYSTVNGPRVSFIGDSDFDADKKSVFKILKAIGEDDLYFPVDIDRYGETYFVFSMDDAETMNEPMNVEVKDETVNEEVAVEVKEVAVNVEVKDAVDLAIEEFNRNLESAVNESVNEIIDHFTSAFIERIKESEHFIEKVDFQKAATVIGKQCSNYAPDLYFSTEDIQKMLVEKVKYDHKFNEASKFELFDDHEVRQFGAYGVSYIDREGDSCYGVPERFKPKSGAAVYAEAKYEKFFKSAVPDSERFEFVGVEPSSHIVELGGKFYVEHRALMCRFMTDAEILAAKPNDDSTDDESYIEMIRESEGDRTDRYVVMIRKIHL